MIRQNALTCESKCPWHKRNVSGRAYTADETWADGACPILAHTLYPYFLTLQHGGSFPEQTAKHGGVCVGCPALTGVDTIVKRGPYEAWMDDPRIEDRQRDFVWAEVVAVHGDCPYQYRVGEKILFPVCMNKHFPCPAAVNNIAPLMQFKWEKCTDRTNLRCPDWTEALTFSAKG